VTRLLSTSQISAPIQDLNLLFCFLRAVQRLAINKSKKVFTTLHRQNHLRAPLQIAALLNADHPASRCPAKLLPELSGQERRVKLVRALDLNQTAVATRRIYFSASSAHDN
jgi:hypothetical protein